MNWIAPLLAFLLPETSTPAPDFLIVARQTSGYTRAQDAFQNQCVLLATGRLEGVLQKGKTEEGWKSTTPFREILDQHETQRILGLLQTASSGALVTGSTECDAGSLEMEGHVSPNLPFVLTHHPDCDVSTDNESPEAKVLIAWISDHCRFEH